MNIDQLIQKHEQKIRLLKQIKQIDKQREFAESLLKVVPIELRSTARAFRKKSDNYLKIIMNLEQSYEKIKI